MQEQITYFITKLRVSSANPASTTPKKIRINNVMFFVSSQLPVTHWYLAYYEYTEYQIWPDLS